MMDPVYTCMAMGDSTCSSYNQGTGFVIQSLLLTVDTHTGVSSSCLLGVTVLLEM